MNGPMVPISSFCRTSSGGTPLRDKADRYYGGSIPWVKSGELRESVITRTEECITELALIESSAKIVPAGSVLIAMYGATVGRVGVLGIDAATNQAVCSIIPDPARADANYLFHCLQSEMPQFLAKRNGGAQPNISQEIIRNTKIALPPLEEQRRIAVILDQAEALQAKRRQALAKLDTLAQSVFREQTERHTFGAFTISDLLRRGYLLAHKDGNHGSQYPRADDFAEDGVAFISAKAITENGEVDYSQVEYLNTKKASQLKIGWIEAGDVLLAHNASVGRVGVYRGQFGRALIGTSLTCFRPNQAKLRTGFLAALLNSTYFQSQLKSNMGQTTRNQVPITAQKRLSLSILPVQTQRKIEEDLERARAIRLLMEQQSFSVEHAISSLQHRAFRGEL